MKRWKHYNKEIAIVLSCFGSISQKDRYHHLKDYIEKSIPNIPVYLSFSSRSVLKVLSKKGLEYYNLPQTLANLDREGYKKIIVSSITLFPTDEHDQIIKIVDGFNIFSPSDIRYTDSIFSKVERTSILLNEITSMIVDYYKSKKSNLIFLFVAHGANHFNQAGFQSILYTKELLESLSSNNLFCSIEKAFPFDIVKDSLLNKISNITKNDPIKLMIVPLLLISGTHYLEDIDSIQKYFQPHFETSIIDSLIERDKFCLIDLDLIKKEIVTNIVNCHSLMI